MSGSIVPTATYRVQLHGKWGFASARAIVPYLKKLGVTHLYSSPILMATRGSMHGYDTVDPRRISDELGGDDEFARLAEELKAHEMGLLLDIVPNHMAIGSENLAWMDVLTHGRASRYADWFDIAWPEKGDAPAIALPMLGWTLDEAIAANEISLEYSNGAFWCRYYELVLPIEPGSWATLLTRAAHIAGGAEGDADAAALLARLAAVGTPEWRGDPEAIREARYEGADALRHELRAAVHNSPKIAQCIDKALRDAPLRDVLDKQPYRLCHWKEAMRQVAYRRFFDITHLIGVRVEDTAVFEATHERILRLVEDGAVTGLRIDHIDGLADPLRYLNRLNEACMDRRTYIAVEKILASEERLDAAWPVAGTSGYDFLQALNGVFVDVSGLRKLAAHQAELCGDITDVQTLMYEQKRRVATELFGGEVGDLVRLLIAIAQGLHIYDVSEEKSRAAIVETSAHLPVYRTYITPDDVRRRSMSDRDRALIEKAMAASARHSVNESSDGLNLLRRILTLDLPSEMDDDTVERVGEFIVKWQQFTGPLAAKGVEDTALYRDARLVSLNEVGADSGHIESPASVDGLHEHNADIAAHWPLTMTCSSTHDTKRSEDVRARIHVLSEIAEEWIAAVARWREMNVSHRTKVDGCDAPDAVAESFLYQNILGAWPLDEMNEAEFAERMVNYAIKAAREAKVHTSWIGPHIEYEDAMSRFIHGVLRSTDWRAEAMRLLDYVAFPGAMNGLSATVLKIASPGVPDFYQGSELWDFSLVDPDNRRPVSYERRALDLNEIASLPDEPEEAALAELMRSWRDGRVKMFVTHRGLGVRSAMRETFLHGDYLPLQARGSRNGHVCTFARHYNGRWIVAIAAVRVVSLLSGDGAPPSEEAWGDTAVELPAAAPVRFRDGITGREIVAIDSRLSIADALRCLPVALLHA